MCLGKFLLQVENGQGSKQLTQTYACMEHVIQTQDSNLLYKTQASGKPALSTVVEVNIWDLNTWFKLL